MQSSAHQQSTVIICKYCMHVMEKGQCMWCSNNRALNKSPERSTVQAPRPTAFHLVEMTPTKRVSISTEKKLGIGRGPENEVSLPNDLYASKDHAAIVYEGGRYWLEDLGSKNGTRINGTTVHNREPINRGDVISIGDSYFLVE